MKWYERLWQRVRTVNPFVVDSLLAVLFTVVGVLSSYSQDIHDNGELVDGFSEPSGWMVVTSIVICGPIAFRRRAPLVAMLVSGAGILVHILIGWPAGTLPLVLLTLTYSVGAWCALREAIEGLASLCVVLGVLAIAGAPGLDGVGLFGVLAQFAAVWAIGVALRSRRSATESRVREAEERAEAERQSAARALAEERLRIAQELHDVVAHSMSVIAVQAGVGAHVLDERPEQARAALEAISATSRGALNELRRLLGVLRDRDGVRSHAPAPGLADLPRLVDDVRAAGVPVTLHVDGSADSVHAGIELSAYRIVQEALTNVIKHAGAPTRVDVSVHHEPGSLVIEVVDDGRGLAAVPRNGADVVHAEGAAQGLLGMRERVEVWGGELSVGPAAGGGFRVRAVLPYGDAKYLESGDQADEVTGGKVTGDEVTGGVVTGDEVTGDEVTGDEVTR